MRRRRKSEPTRVGTVLPKVLSELGLDEANRAIVLERRWREIVGDEVADHATPDVLRGRTLDVGVDSPAWSHALTLRREELLRSLHEALGEEAPEELRFHLGRR